MIEWKLGILIKNLVIKIKYLLKSRDTKQGRIRSGHHCCSHFKNYLTK